MANEMAHYAADCWDAELQTSYGWIECVGCADRSAYDLTVHAKKTGAPLMVRERLTEPISIKEWQVELDKKKFGPRFKKDGKAVEAAVEALPQDKREALAQGLKLDGKIMIDVEGVGNGKVEIGKDLIVIERRTRVENTREYTPNVIEPSFGIGRILYALIEHNYWTRASDGGDEARGVSYWPPYNQNHKINKNLGPLFPTNSRTYQGLTGTSVFSREFQVSSHVYVAQASQAWCFQPHR